MGQSLNKGEVFLKVAVSLPSPSSMLKFPERGSDRGTKYSGMVFGMISKTVYAIDQS